MDRAELEACTGEETRPGRAYRWCVITCSKAAWSSRSAAVAMPMLRRAARTALPLVNRQVMTCPSSHAGGRRR